MKRFGILILICILVCAAVPVCGEEMEDAGFLPLEDRAAAVLPDFEDLIPWFEEDLYDIMGIEEDDYADFIYLTDDSGMEGREVIMICCVSAEAAERTEAALTAYLERRIRETQNYLPDAWYLLSNAVLIRQENTVLLISGADAAAEAELLLAAE